MTYISVSPGSSYYIHEMIILTCVGFLFKGEGAIIRDGAVIRSFMVYHLVRLTRNSCSRLVKPNAAKIKLYKIFIL